MHYRSGIICMSLGITTGALLELGLQAFWDVVPVNGDKVVTIWSGLLMPVAYRIKFLLY